MKLGDRKLALITRPIDDAQRTKHQLHQIAIDSFVEPMLHITHLLDAEENIKRHSDNCQGIIVTSANALYAIDNFSVINKDMLIVTVGEHTAKVARALGYSNVRSACGNVLDLKEFLVNNYNKDLGNFIYASADIITNELKIDGLAIDRIIVYKSVATKQLSDECLRLLDEQAFDYMLFFSVRTAEIFVNLAADYICSNVVAFCISDNVAAQLNRLDFKKIITADSANSESLLEKINNFKFT